MLVWMPEPLARLGLSSPAFSSLIDGMKDSLRGVLLVGRIEDTDAGDSSSGDPELSFDMVFILDSPELARIYRPILRLAWFYMARKLMQTEPSSPLPAFVRHGEKIYASDIRIRASRLANFTLG